MLIKSLLKEANKSNKPFYYRWWGLYKAQKDMYANSSSVGSLMITNKQWELVLTIIGDYKTYQRPSGSYGDSTFYLSGSAYANNGALYDVCLNVYDLAGNYMELTSTFYSFYATQVETNSIIRGSGFTGAPNGASYTNSGGANEDYNLAISPYSSRTCLYIKK